MTTQAVIHCKPQILDNEELINNSNLLVADVNDYGEVDIYVDDQPYQVIDGIYQAPDEQLCEHYGIDYDLVNCIEAVD